MARYRKRPRRTLLSLAPDEAFWVLACLLVLVFALGGGSRADIESLAWLRPLAFIAAAIGMLGLRREQVRACWMPLALLGLLAVLMAAQLVPLPPSLWTQLPGREGIARLDALVGLADAWRPITLSPMKTANSLVALIVPFAVLVLYCQLTERRRRDILLVLVGLAVAGACIGFLQVLAGPRSGLYFYEITSRGAAVGWFANRNHHAVFMAAAMLIALHLATERGRSAHALLPVLCFAAAAVLAIAVIGNVSRAGLLSLGVALVLAPLAISAREEGKAPAVRPMIWRAGLFAVPVLGVFVLFAFSQRSPALERLLTDNATDDARARILPSLIEMVQTHQPLGTGFGAFEYAYRIEEPAALVVPSYFNNAHNDWLQVAIEGGVAGTLLLAVVVATIAWRAVRLRGFAEMRDEASLARAWLGFAVLAILGFASLFDYPLRVPSIMAVGIISLVMLNGPVLGQFRRKGCDAREAT